MWLTMHKNFCNLLVWFIKHIKTSVWIDGSERSGVEWNTMEWSGTERNGMTTPFHCLVILRRSRINFSFRCLESERNVTITIILFHLHPYFKTDYYVKTKLYSLYIPFSLFFLFSLRYI